MTGFAVDEFAVADDIAAVPVEHARHTVHKAGFVGTVDEEDVRGQCTAYLCVRSRL